MKKIVISDVSLRESASHAGELGSFKERVSFARQLDAIGVDIIETMPITESGTDLLFLKTIAPIIKNSILSCPAAATKKETAAIIDAVKNASHPRLHVILPTSAVQMEYLCRKKPKQMLEEIASSVSYCASLCSDVEFSAADATRSDFEFLCSAINTAIDAGAKTVTICDTAGVFLPGEFGEFVAKVISGCKITADITVGVECKDELSSAAAASIAGIAAGASLIKTSAIGFGIAKLADVSKIIQLKGAASGICSSIKAAELNRTLARLSGVTDAKSSADDIWGNDSSDTADETRDRITAPATVEDISAKIVKLGYDLDESDTMAVYNSVCHILNKKKSVNLKELDRIIATDAMQSTPIYSLVSFVITSGNHIHATASMELEYKGERKSCAALGDGPIDAALHAIESITGCRFELDDFQIRSITEGKEALGEAFIRLRNNGKIYSGRGLSTDITGAGIRAYLSAVNKVLADEQKN